MSPDDDPADLSEGGLSSPLHDQAETTGPRQRLIVCTTPRSGSYLLSRQLIRAGLGVPHEYLNPVVAEPISRRAGVGGTPLDRAQYLAWLDRHRTTPNGVFAAKVHWSQFAADPVAQQRWFAGSPRPVLVFLYRRGLSAQAHSLRKAALSGVWDASRQVSTIPPRGLRGFAFDDLDRLTYKIMHWNGMWRLGFEAWGVTPLDVAYEDLVADQPAQLSRIAAALGVDIAVPESEPAPSAASDEDRQRRDRVVEYARSWTSQRNAGGTTRRLARAVALDFVRSSARRTGRSSRSEPPGWESQL